ncbi:3592_t:CDS:2 [Funneliformis geosporum]|uniref:3592_t:CDS:1 n=1 Tax=Funneliformis geosporum TaxID=1117311 RepID=A0A9W4SBW7_9GLOM|nr:3592_t:CDS:2 [Funneliformis geosporum]
MVDQTDLTDLTNFNIYVSSVKLLHPNKTTRPLYFFTNYCSKDNPNCSIKKIIPFKANNIIMIYIEYYQYVLVIADWFDEIIFKNKVITLPPELEIGTPLTQLIIQDSFYNESSTLLLLFPNGDNKLFYNKYIYNEDNGRLIIHQEEGFVTFKQNLTVYPADLFSIRGGYGILSFVLDFNFKGVQQTFLTLVHPNKISHLNLTLQTSTTSTNMNHIKCKADMRTNYICSCLILSNDQRFILAEIDDDFQVKTRDLKIEIEYDSLLITYPASEVYFMILFYFRSSKSINLVLFNVRTNDLTPSSKFNGGYLNYTSHSDIARFILHDNELVIAVNMDKEIWELKSINISQFIPETNKLNNFHITKTWPVWNENIYNDTKIINITFIHPIKLTGKANASIYQYYNGEYLLRQTYKCMEPNCVPSKDEYSISLTVMETTFNIPEMTYHIEIDDDFAEFRMINQDIPGIKKESWPIHTLSTDKPKPLSSVDMPDSYTGILRLTVEDTNAFKELDKDKKVNFLEQMRIEIAKSIPVDFSRLNDLQSTFVYEKGYELLLITYVIDPSNENNFNKKSSQEVANDFTKLLKNSSFTTPLDIYHYTKFIDKNYGSNDTCKYYFAYIPYLVNHNNLYFALFL